MSIPETRPDHYKYDLPVRFFWENRMATGRCVVVSETGMQASLKPSPDIWVTGSLTAELEVRSISLKARVIRVDDEGTAFSFRVTTERERHELNLLLAAAMERGKLIPLEE